MWHCDSNKNILLLEERVESTKEARAVFKKIVLATDLSPAWDEIVACAGEFKALGCSQVILAHVITVKFMGGLEATIKAEAQPKIEAQKRQLEAQGLQVSVEMPMGLPAYSLNEVAHRHGADLIVVGSHGKSLWREGVLGCVSCAILHHTQYPTLLLNVKIKEEKEEGTCRLHCHELLRHILFPTDFSEIAGRAFGYLERLAAKGVTQVTLLHALEAPGGEAYPPGFQETAEAAARGSLENLNKRLEMVGVPVVHTLFSQGHLVHLILEALGIMDFSLIIMGTQGRGFIREIFLGSVAHNISRLASGPVLLIPPLTR
jgi:nucleotide-binding universal stress UspA family protein